MIDDLPIDTVEQDPPVSNKPNPNLTGLIVELCSITLDSDPDSDVDKRYLAYITTKTVLRDKHVKSFAPGDLIPAIFVYYLTSYTGLIQKTSSTSLADNEIMNEALVGLFGLYETSYDDLTLRRLVSLSAKSIHAVVTETLSRNLDLKVQDCINNLASLALVTETISTYTSGRYRVANIPYIAWLEKFFKMTLASSDLSFMKTDSDVKHILTQLTENKKIITLL